MTNNLNMANIDISLDESTVHFNNKLKEAKVILACHEAGILPIQIGYRLHITENQVHEIINQGIEKTEIKLKRFYNMENTQTPVEATVVAEPVVEAVTTPEPVVTAPVQTTRIKGGVKLAEEKIVEMLKAKPEGMPVKELKTSAPAEVNASTWVIRISKLKTAGKITIVDGVAKAV